MRVTRDVWALVTVENEYNTRCSANAGTTFQVQDEALIIFSHSPEIQGAVPFAYRFRGPDKRRVPFSTELGSLVMNCLATSSIVNMRVKPQ